MKYSYILFLFISLPIYCQNTIQLEEGLKSPKASLEDVSWIAGHWQGEAFGGITEEIWSPPLGNSMMFVFKLLVNGKVQFYEIGHIQEQEETLLLQLKHFSGNLKGWETKDETIDFKLVKIEENKVYFEGFTMEKVTTNEINIYVLIEHEDGTKKEEKFNYKKL
ncbi:hypothetical protein CLV91_0616 [Maribacter vaceletii]|uniref:DUF6265 domain-containing protein n=1 Tax=Maribacter vaceletii TaxID=1206816 RepID=A0A495ED43_9FLAO|nr:DUF6265 family protein [Maribacter vaceletii]RKR14539.1 hypothetical protein CLV91_0616 [Maribacter vaceletii]